MTSRASVFTVPLVAFLLLGCPGVAPAQEPPPPPYPPGGPESAEPAPPTDEPAYSDTDPSALSDFEGALSPYGQWVDDPTYGTVWVPYEAQNPDFQPYLSDGHWVYDDDGWTWVSDYAWGAIPFHYGRWVQIPRVGWSWVPGRVYSGAWVDWRTGNGYVGWAPLPPDWAWRGRIASPLRARPAPRFHFVRSGSIFDARVARQAVSGPAYVDRTAPFVQAAPPAHRGAFFRGPAPGVLGIPQAQVVRPPPRDPGLARARAYQSPPRRGVTLPQPPSRGAGQAPPRTPERNVQRTPAQNVPRRPEPNVPRTPEPNVPRAPERTVPRAPAPNPAPQGGAAPARPAPPTPGQAPNRNVAPPAHRTP